MKAAPSDPRLQAPAVVDAGPAPVEPPPSSSGAPLPPPRGPLTTTLFAALGDSVHPLGGTSDAQGVDEEDLQLALYCCYELHYGGFSGVDPAWEWEPTVLALRRRLEGRLERQLQLWVGEAAPDLAAPSALARAAGDSGPAPGRPPGARSPNGHLPVEVVVERLRVMAAATGGPSVSAWLAEHGTVAHVREVAVHRSAYQLKEADPHTWSIPRLPAAAKAPMVAIQAGEYGDGDGAEVHSVLFAGTLTALGVDTRPNALLGRLPADTLRAVNMVSLFGLHRRWRGALVGHLALFEMTSTVPMRRDAATLARLGLPPSARRFAEAHVAADAVHARVAAEAMVPGLLRSESYLASDVLFGAAALQAVEARAAAAIIAAWRAGRSSLLPAIPVPAQGD